MVRIFRGGVLDERFEGSVVVIGPKPTQMTGLVKGDLFVRDNSTCEVIGMVTGNLVAERTGKAILRGMVGKDVKSVGGDVEIHGMVIGNVANEGGRRKRLFRKERENEERKTEDQCPRPSSSFPFGKQKQREEGEEGSNHVRPCFNEVKPHVVVAGEQKCPADQPRAQIAARGGREHQTDDTERRSQRQKLARQIRHAENLK